MSDFRIFLDLDDVLNAFTMSALKFVGCPVDNCYAHHQYEDIWGWDIVLAARNLLGHNCPTSDNAYWASWFWKRLTDEFWLSIPLSMEFNDLLEMSADYVGEDNVCILTSPTSDPRVASCKAQWIDTYVPKWLSGNRLIGGPKRFCASNSSILIDDSDDNINSFRKYGGHGILFPRPWNTMHGSQFKATESLECSIQEIVDRGGKGWMA